MQEITRLGIDEISPGAAAIALFAVAGGAIVLVQGFATDGIAA